MPHLHQMTLKSAGKGKQIIQLTKPNKFLFHTNKPSTKVIKKERKERRKEVFHASVLYISYRVKEGICISTLQQGHLVVTTIWTLWCRSVGGHYDLMVLSVPLHQPATVCCLHTDQPGLVTDLAKHSAAICHNCKYAYMLSNSKTRQE